jgi:hypothetical protein
MKISYQCSYHTQSHCPVKAEWSVTCLSEIKGVKIYPLLMIHKNPA